MYIVVIAWMYVILMVSVFQSSVFRGVVTFVGAGLLPLALVLYLFGTPQRRRQRIEEEKALAQQHQEQVGTDPVAPPSGPSKPD